jgi:hypothetical protein
VATIVGGTGESFAAPPQLLLVAVAVLSAVLGELRDAIAVLSHRHAGRFSSFGCCFGRCAAEVAGQGAEAGECGASQGGLPAPMALASLRGEDSASQSRPAAFVGVRHHAPIWTKGKDAPVLTWEKLEAGVARPSRRSGAIHSPRDVQGGAIRPGSAPESNISGATHGGISRS